ncbi:hypothetical protein [Parapedobacter lycopersici]|nr:hypothetical protein [Parapedobacter lycopersici]
MDEQQLIKQVFSLLRFLTAPNLSCGRKNPFAYSMQVAMCCR